MSGFGKVSFVGEYYNQKIVNVFWFRSEEWLPLGGNPFDDVQAFVDSVLSGYEGSLLAALPTDYTLQTVEGVGYDDAFNIVTASPLIRTVNHPGTISASAGMGAAQCAIISLRCGEQHSINGTGKSKRNRGYVAIGPLPETTVDNYSHIVSAEESLLVNLGSAILTNRTIVLPPVTLIPIRIHEKWSTILGIKHLDWRTYSDVQGFRVNRVASYRRSRQPEA